MHGNIFSHKNMVYSFALIVGVFGRIEGVKVISMPVFHNKKRKPVSIATKLHIINSDSNPKASVPLSFYFEGPLLRLNIFTECCRALINFFVTLTIASQKWFLTMF